MEEKKLNLKLHIWRQKNPDEVGKFKVYEAKDVSEHISFLEMIDIINEDLVSNGEDPIAFEHDCREGICGSCSMMINGNPHGPKKRTTACQLHMRTFNDGDEVVVEPWRAKAFPVIKDLIVDRSGFDNIIESGGYISARTGSPPDGNAILVNKDTADTAFDAAACIGCGACVAACPNGSAMLFTAAKVSHLNRLPQGEPERTKRVLNMVKTMDEEGFGGCTNHGECQESCPKSISISNINYLNREYLKAMLLSKRDDSAEVKAQ